MREAALRALALGPVFQCVGKKPMTPNGFHDATSDPAEVDARWRLNARMNPAFVNGATITLDIDSNRAKGKFGDVDLVELVRDNGPIPQTLQVLTPTGGAHFHFRCPEGVVIRRKIRVLGSKWIDVLGVGGYCMAPDAEIDGDPYIIVDPSPVAVLSGWLLDRILAEQTDPVVETPKPSAHLGRYRDVMPRLDRALRYVDKMPEAISGSGGHVSLWRVACVLVHRFALPDEASLEALRYYSQRCSPPWSEKDLRHKLAQAKKNATVYAVGGELR